MEFNDNKPISLQIEDYCRERICRGEWPPGSRVPSTKDLAVRLGVNPRTVMKAYDALAEAAAIRQKRGMGYYVAENATENLLDIRRREFFSNTLPELARTLRELGISPARLAEELENYQPASQTPSKYNPE